MSSAAQAYVATFFKNILFATDLSPSTRVAFPHLRVLAGRHGSTIHMVHVMAPEPMLELPLDRIPEMDADQDAAMRAMKRMLADEPFGLIPCTCKVTRGELWQALSAVIEEKQIDLIVVGTHGRRGLSKLVLGSVCEQVFRQAACPVLTVGPHVSAGLLGRDSTILFATEFSEGSERALQYAAGLARKYGAHLVMLHAVPMSLDVVPSHFFNLGSSVEVITEYVAETVAEARRRVMALLPAETMAELRPEVVVDCGAAAEKILSMAENKRANLIVMGAHGASAHSMSTHLPWATASKVVCEAACPVLTVRG